MEVMHSDVNKFLQELKDERDEFYPDATLHKVIRINCVLGVQYLLSIPATTD